MKKILLFSCILICIPILIVNIFFKNNEINFIYFNEPVVRVMSNNTIKDVFLEDYVVGVLAGEMPINFEKEALKAQAVASRTYVLKKMIENKDNDYDVVDTVENQVYLDYEYLKTAWNQDYIKNINKLKKIAKETKGEYLVYNNTIIDALFFSTSSGYTENSEEVFSVKMPYLRSVESKWDKISPVYQETKYYSKNEFCSLIGIKCTENILINYDKKTSTGRNIEVSINNKKFKASDLVSFLKLKSSFFEIEIKDKIIITTRGYGHGVGMSQYGAQGMALQNKNYKDILAYYYKNTKLQKS